MLAPSRTGGTNLIACPPAAPASPMGRVVRPAPGGERLAIRSGSSISAGTALDLDTRADLIAAAGLPGGAWLADYLV